MTNKAEMADKPLSKLEDIAAVFKYKEDAHGIWRSSNIDFQLDHQHVWSLRHVMDLDNAWLLLKDGFIAAMSKERSPFLLLAAANGITLKEEEEIDIGSQMAL